jgi:ribosomal protein S18 acetylase RimI-like enzyme
MGEASGVGVTATWLLSRHAVRRSPPTAGAVPGAGGARVIAVAYGCGSGNAACVDAVVIRHADQSDDGDLAGLVPDLDRRAWRVRNAVEGRESLLVAVVRDQVVGAVSVRWSGGCDAPNPWLYGGEVLARWRNRGVGTALWLAAHRECRARGFQFTSLDADAANARARRLYERLGYVVVGPHEHRWVARNQSGAITAQGFADTSLMRCRLVAVEAGGE